MCRVWYYPWCQASAVGLGMYFPHVRMGGGTVCLVWCLTLGHKPCEGGLWSPQWLTGLDRCTPVERPWGKILRKGPHTGADTYGAEGVLKQGQCGSGLELAMLQVAEGMLEGSLAEAVCQVTKTHEVAPLVSCRYSGLGPRGHQLSCKGRCDYSDGEDQGPSNSWIGQMTGPH